MQIACRKRARTRCTRLEHSRESSRYWPLGRVSTDKRVRGHVCQSPVSRWLVSRVAAVFEARAAVRSRDMRFCVARKHAPRTQPRIFAILTTGDRVIRTNVSVRTGRPEGPTAVMTLPSLPVQSKWLRKKSWFALSNTITRTLAGSTFRACEQVLQGLEHRPVCNVERRIVENNPPIRRRFLRYPQWRSGLSHDSRPLFPPR